MRYISCKDIHIACPFMTKDNNHIFGQNNTNVAIMFYIIGYPHIIQQFNKAVFVKKQKNDIYYSNSKIKILPKSCYDVYTYKDEKTDINSILYVYNNKTPFIDSNNINIYMYYNNQMSENELHSLLFKNINKYIDIPILEQWSDYLWTFAKNCMHKIYSTVDLSIYTTSEQDHLRLQLPLINHIAIRKNELINHISDGLKNNIISINGFNTNTNKIDNITGLDSYLSSYSNILANKIQNIYRPQFVPGKDNYNNRLQNFDDSCYFNHMNLFCAQKYTIQATVNALQNKKASFIIGEQGSGKTVMSLGACYSYKNRDGFNAVIMCPSHLVNKWQREIESYVPNGKAYIIKNIDDIIKLDAILRNKKKIDNVFLIMSKETAKLDNEYRPNVYYSISKRHYICPHCGKPIKSATDRYSYLYDADFRKQLISNSVCYECGTNLWVPVSNNNDHWVKLGSNGWINSLRIENIYNNLINKQNRNKQESDFLRAIEIYRNNNTAFSQPNYTRYPLAKYIHNKYKGYIDFLIADELHLYNGNSAQGEAFGYLASIANKVIGLTGTLLNGYADSIFYMLFRTMPSVMLNEGFDINSITKFNQDFGIIKNTRTLAPGINGKVTSYTKKLPGVSPLVFTKFLLENAVFVSLSDMLDGLPNYSEYPIGVTMSDTLAENYTEFETKIAKELTKNKKIIGSVTKTLSAYPDYPYELEPIVNPETNTIVAIPKNIDVSNTILPKEQTLLDIVEEKHNNNEKVLVYYTWTNMIDLDNRLKQILENRGYRVGILRASISAQNREQWVKDHINDIDVLLCNPSLVETGLDLLDFTTIVFYEIGYNLFTMRQSSRRSWRLGQTRPISVYYLYYQNTIQEQALSLMATKLQASMAIEGKFNEEGLQALSDNEDILTQIANNIVNGIKNTVNENCFKTIITEQYHNDIVINNNIEKQNNDEFDLDADLIDDDIDIANNTIDVDNSVIVQSIISEPTKIFRRTKYEIEGKKYNMCYWNHKNQNIFINNNIIQILNNNQNIEELCDCAY